MEKIVKIFKEIKETSGTNAKQELLRKYANVPLFKEVLEFRFSSRVLTNVSTAKFNKNLGKTFQDYTRISDLKGYMKFLAEKCTGKDVDLYSIHVFVNKYEKDIKTFLVGLATKKLSIGINASGVNKVFSGLVPSFAIMKGHKYEDHEAYITDKVIIATLKKDGHRSIIHREGDKLIILTSGGNVREGLVELESVYKTFKDGHTYDGELEAIIKGNANLEKLKKEGKLTASAIHSETGSLLTGKGEKTGVAFNIFDTLPTEEFYKGISKKIYKERRKDMDKLIENKYIKVLKPLYTGKMDGKVFDLFNKYIEMGEEGLMLNTEDGLYVAKRTKDILKMKKFYTMDLEILDIIEGTGNSKGRAEKVVVDYKGSENGAGMGKGITVAMKKDLLENKHKYKGKIALISYQNQSSNKKGGESLRLPKFLGIREDKTKKDISYD